MIFILHNKQSIYFVYYSFVYTFEVILNKGKNEITWSTLTILAWLE
jgi:hypothetical protein